MGSRCVKYGVIALTLILVTGSSTWHLMAKNFLRIWKKDLLLYKKDGVGYKKIAKTLKLSCSIVAKTIQRFNRTGSTQNKPRHGRPKKLSARAQHHIQRLYLGNRRMSAASIAAEVEQVGSQPVSAAHTLYTASNCLHGCHPRRKPLPKMMHKKARKQFAEDKQTREIDYWNHVLWSDETKINLFSSDGLKCVWLQPGEEYLVQACLAYRQAWWWECHGLGLHECCWHWGATVHWGNHEWQHILWNNEAEHDPLPFHLKTGPQGSIPTW